MVTKSRSSVALLRVAHARAGTRIVYALAASALTAWLLPPSLSREVRAVASRNGFAILAVVVLLQTSKKMLGAEKIQVIVLALSAVALAWFLIHTVCTLR